ncbi:serine hydrolase domain-containing protein [Paraburkholderia acidisoli]|uniref:Serine hydrolase n=1 Tax=Paraburkholderia acidisoli TaxID=2571748 RepID=A0A7Z2GND2_9BURK|nr:serine hydrolase domain-containing protein [Paraburkholderia acidisoli]QGZ64977.1 serine hydrolase [Paraburkholderia acidisoli]
MQTWLDDVIASGRIPGVSLATLRAGEPAFAYAGGWRGAHDAARIDTRTVFEAASLTKPLVAYLALQLADENRLDLHAPLRDIGGDYLPGDARSHAITAWHVLTHTSGLPNIVREAAPLKTYFAPGERFSYGSSAFAWLQRALEAVSGRTLEALALERIFTPLAMRDSSLIWQARFEANYAQGHEWDGEPVAKRRLETAQASWSLVTTAQDYLRFVRAVLRGEGLSRDSHARWFTPAVPTRQGNDAEDLAGANPLDPHVAWGLGWGLEPAQQCCFHWGNCPGFRAFVMGNRATQDAVVWFANSARGLRLVHEVLPHALAGDHPAVRWLRIGEL